MYFYLNENIINYIGNGKYYDPWTGKTGDISNLTLSYKWKSTDTIKSPHRYLDYQN
jgi:hypothetical protein